MKTLKKTLSLTLVFALVFSLMSMAFAAETTTTSTTTTGYKDAADITYKEAVDVTSAIGVFQGNDLGAFAPKDNLTREQAAKIICYLSMGQAAADKLSTSSAPFADVAADRWSAGSIAYCVQQGIVAGYGNGNFGPTDTVTGYQFAKMLLVALGYDATIEGFTGNDWQINVAKRAFQNKLSEGNDAFVGTAAATREEAALYTKNTLLAQTVTYANKGTEIKLPDGTVIRQGASAPSQAGNLTFMAAHYPKLSVTNTSDAAGQAVRIWRNGVTVIGTYAANAAIASWSADHTGTDTTVERALAGYTYAATVNVYTNGALSTITTGYTAAIKALTGNGKLVEVFADANNVINRVSVTQEELATIINKDTVNKTVTVQVAAGTILLTEKSDPTNFGGAYAALYGKNVGDKVLLVANGTTAIYSYADPAVISGQYTANKNGVYTIGGKEYEEAAGASLSLTLGQNVSLFVDSYGYLKAVGTSTSTATYAFMLQGSRDGSAMAGYTYNAQLLFGDGTVKWVTIGAYDNNTAETAKNTATTLSNVFVGYTALADGSYALATVTPATDAIAASVTITKDSSVFNNNLVSNSTVFVIYNAATKTYESYKGIKNVPTTVANANSAFGLLNADSTAYGMVVVKAGTSATTTADVIYITNATAVASEFINNTTVYTYKAIVNGVIGTVKSTQTASVGLKLGSTYTNGIITTFGSATGSVAITGSADVVIAKADSANKVLTGTVAADKIALTDGVLTIDGVPASYKTTGIVGDNFVCYVVATDGTVTVKSLGSTASNAAGALNLVVDANGYVAYAMIVLS